MQTMRTLTIGILIGALCLLGGWFALQRLDVGNENIEGESAIEQQVNEHMFEGGEMQRSPPYHRQISISPNQR